MGGKTDRHGLKVTEQRLCDQVRMISMNGWLTELQCNQTKHDEHAENNVQNIKTGMIKVKVWQMNVRI